MPRAGRPKAANGALCREIVSLYLTQPVSVREVARMYSLSSSTVWRIIESAGLPGSW